MDRSIRRSIRRPRYRPHDRLQTRPARSAPTARGARPRIVAEALALVPYLAAGTGFGALLIRSEVASWYRIQEMFRFHSFHMYGVIGSAVAVAALSVWLLRRRGTTTFAGDPITVTPKARTWRRYVLGGAAFGVGWALLGACPGPVLALIGAGAPAFAVALLAALAGTWTYGALHDRLPH